MGNDLGWGISDVIEIRRDELPDLNQQPPIYWERIRKKTKQIAKTCLSVTTIALLKEYLFSFPTKNPYLFHLILHILSNCYERSPSIRGDAN